MPCGDSLIWVHLVFWPMVIVLAVIIARHNSFGLKDALLAAVGIKKFNRSPLINILTASYSGCPIGVGDLDHSILSGLSRPFCPFALIICFHL